MMRAASMIALPENFERGVDDARCSDDALSFTLQVREELSPKTIRAYETDLHHLRAPRPRTVLTTLLTTEKRQSHRPDAPYYLDDVA
jgi:hypothetical protein